jgi:DNA-binding NtrC family response regulator
VRQRKDDGAELSQEIAKALVDAVRRQVLSDIEWKLLLASKPQGAADALPSLAGMRPPEAGPGINLYDEMRRYEINLIRRALHQARGKQVIAARLLGIKATTLNNKIKHYDIKWEAGQ